MVPELSFLETRVLGVLAEKERTVPDTYPLTLNALVSGCNQKTSRDPVISATETEVQATLDTLRAKSLVIESSGGRVARYSHNIERALQIMRAEIKEFVAGPAYADERACVQAGTVSEQVVMASLVASCILKINQGGGA